MRRLALSVFCLLQVSGIHAEAFGPEKAFGLVKVAGVNGAYEIVSRSSIIRKGNLVSIKALVYPADSFPLHGKDVTSMITQYRFNCSDRTYKLLEVLDYADDNTLVQKERPLDIILTVNPNSMTDGVFKIACNAK